MQDTHHAIIGVADCVVKVNVGLRGSGRFGLTACALACLLGHRMIPKGNVSFISTI